MHSSKTIPKDAVKIGDFWYYEGLELICKKHYKAKNIRLYTNYSYILQSIDKDKKIRKRSIKRSLLFLNQWMV